MCLANIYQKGQGSKPLVKSVATLKSLAIE